MLMLQLSAHLPMLPTRLRKTQKNMFGFLAYLAKGFDTLKNPSDKGCF